MRRKASAVAMPAKNISGSEARRNVRGSDTRWREEERNIRRNAACGRELLESQSAAQASLCPWQRPVALRAASSASREKSSCKSTETLPPVADD